MKARIRSITQVAAILLAMSVGAAAAGFFSSIEDLPLPEGFDEAKRESFVFESPAGRIVTAVARGRGEVATVRGFYHEAMPPLGWEALSGDRYRRADEHLSLAFERAGGVVTIRVRLVPADAGK